MSQKAKIRVSQNMCCPQRVSRQILFLSEGDPPLLFLSEGALRSFFLSEGVVARTPCSCPHEPSGARHHPPRASGRPLSRELPPRASSAAVTRPAGSSRRASWCSATQLLIIWADDLGGNRAGTVEGAPCPAFVTCDASYLMLMTCAATRRPERSTPACLLTAACLTAVLPASA